MNFDKILPLLFKMQNANPDDFLKIISQNNPQIASILNMMPKQNHSAVNQTKQTSFKKYTKISDFYKR